VDISAYDGFETGSIKSYAESTGMPDESNSDGKALDAN
jgi:hypothetical protein